jgi:putative ABC transport system permease protein
MKATMYLSYPTRSLARGGQRTWLAIFCVAVGVMAVVALQLVGNMVSSGLTGNVREGNGGDLSVSSGSTPFTEQQLTTFDQLKANGDITGYTAISSHRGSVRTPSGSSFYILRAVDPQQFPLAGAPYFDTPTSGNLSSLLGGDNVVVTSNLLQTLGAHVGDTVTFPSNDGRALHGTIAGVIESTGYFTQPQALVSLADYKALTSTSGLPVTYSDVYANVPNHSDASATTAKNDITKALPLATVTTTHDALQQNQSSVQQIRYFLQVVGLLALLIGGVGIINTMQVLLRRRQTEIAMLKTAGYRQRELYTLFGLEAAELGLIGGVIGSAAGVGVSFLVKSLVEQAFFIHLPATIDPLTVASGVAIGFFTALIFGLLPIVKASQVRPLAVLRDLTERANIRGGVLTAVLLVLLVALFFVLALAILGNLSVAALVVGGAGAFLLVLGLFFGLVVLVISKAPVPERYTWWYALLVGAATLGTAALTWFAPQYGALFLALSLLGVIVPLLPRTWKATIRLSLRNIGRQRARTVTTLVALFVGVFAIGLVLALGQTVKDTINTAFTTQLKYNAFVIAGHSDTTTVDAQLRQAKGIQAQTTNLLAQDTPVSVNSVPVTQLVPAGSSQRQFGPDGGQLGSLTSVEGYNLSRQTPSDLTITKGRALGSQDTGTANTILPDDLTKAPLSLKIGDRVTLLGSDHKTMVTFTVVGFYTTSSINFVDMFADNGAVTRLAVNQPATIYSLKVDPKQADQTLFSIQQAAPAVGTFSTADLSVMIDNLLNNLVLLLTTVASLAMLAGLIIIANTVALAMLERQRELGILKSVGYTSRSVLSGVLLENGVIGFTGALLAMGLVVVATAVLTAVLFGAQLGLGSFNAPMTLGVIGATALVCMLVAGAVSWNSTRVRPLQVLRYE